MNTNKELNFKGRPDGIGNRVEEIIVLEAISVVNNIKFNYYWENSVYRNYNILLNSQNVNLKLYDNEALERKLEFSKLSDFNQNFNQSDFFSVAKNIKPLFEISFQNNIRPIGVHIRGTDRIDNLNETYSNHFMKDTNEFSLYLSKTISLINDLEPPFIFICSDDNLVKDKFIKHLNKKIKVVEPICKEFIPEEYKDFFALTLCSRLYMCSKFSTFTITASLIANVPIVAYILDTTVSERYKALFEYETDLENINYINFFPISKPSFKYKIKKLIKKALNVKS